MILIGSNALACYVNLGRKIHDWDLICTKEELNVINLYCSKKIVKKTNYSIIYDIDGAIVEIRNPDTLDPTDIKLFSLINSGLVNTPIGIAGVLDIQTLYDIKKSTYLCIQEPKHKHDLDLIEEWAKKPGNRKLDDMTAFFIERLAETKKRVDNSNKVMYDFFHKYHIPEYVQHDRLHDMIADLLDMNYPTYKRITVAETDIAEDLFNKLTHNQKISLMMEESLVLNLERWFIPQMVEKGINYRLIDKFYNSNEAMPTYKILKHVCLTGLKGEAKYITDFSKSNFFEIELRWLEAKEKIRAKGGFPSWFFQELFDLRTKYKSGEAVGLHNERKL